MTILSQLEPQFSFRSSNLLFGTRQTSGTNRPVIQQFNFNTLTYTDILDLGSITTISNNTFARALAGSAAAPEKLSVNVHGSNHCSREHARQSRAHPGAAQLRHQPRIELMTAVRFR